MNLFIASFLIDTSFLLPFLGAFLVFLTTFVLSGNIKRLSLVLVLFFGYLPLWCFRKYLDVSTVSSFLAVASIAVLVWLGTTKSKPLSPQNTDKVISFLSAATILLFWTISGALYFDYLDLKDLALIDIGNAGKGNHFMWYSGLDLLFGWTGWVPESTYLNPFWHTFAMFQFLIFYPLGLKLGIKIGKISFGRSPKQVGLAGNF